MSSSKSLFIITRAAVFIFYSKSFPVIFWLYSDIYTPNYFLTCHKLNSAQFWEASVAGKSCVSYFTFALQRSHPQLQHYAPTTGLDPSPLQEFSLLIRSRLVLAAPGSQTFKALSWSFGWLFEILLWFGSDRQDGLDKLKHFSNEQRVHFGAPRSLKSAAKEASSEVWGRKINK